MLINCPECNSSISDKAFACPICGFPMKTNEKPGRPSKASSKKRMRLPNGFGRITEIKGRNLRKPFRAMVTTGKSETGKLIVKPLKPESFFKTYNEAYAALSEYHKNPYDLESFITLEDLYDKWSKQYFKAISPSSIRTVESAWAYCDSISGMSVKDIRARHLKGVIEDGYRIGTGKKDKGQIIYPSAGVKSRIKSILNLMFDYAVEYEITDRNYARTFEISDDVIEEAEKVKNAHIPFTEDELQSLWTHVDTVKYVDWLLIQSYMGWRPQELGELRTCDVDLDSMVITGGMKTESGKRRTVPIHSKVQPLVKKNYEASKAIGSDYLLNDKGQTHSGKYQVTYDKYRHRFDKVISELNLNPDHRAHDPRVTFVTRAKKAGISDGAIKKIVGHKITDITEAAYTKRDIEWLRKDIEKLT